MIRYYSSMHKQRGQTLLQHLWTTLLDAVLPASESVRAIRTLSTTEFVAHYRPGHFQSITFLSPYDEPLVRAAIHANKYEHYQPAAQLLAKLLDTWLRTQPTDVVIVPIPLFPRRQRERGHNQLDTILRYSQMRPTVQRNWLARTRNTTPQVSLSRAARRENMIDAFTIKKQPKLAPGSTVVLLDDVITTGATMKAARAALAPHLPTDCTLICLALAH